MSARAERVFLPTLRELERDLTVPIPERVRILRELEFDLEELRARLEAEGLSSEGARARALEMAPDGATLREMGRLHTPTYLRVTRRLSGDRLRVIERWTLALATASVLIIEAAGGSRRGLCRNARGKGEDEGKRVACGLSVKRAKHGSSWTGVTANHVARA